MIIKTQRKVVKRNPEIKRRYKDGHQVEFAGVKFRAEKFCNLAPSTLGGGLFAAFEFYKDYLNMKAKIESYTLTTKW